jgi:hypothetical protein
MSDIINSSAQLKYFDAQDAALAPAQLIQHISLIQNIMSSVMKKDEHYGAIPGTGNKLVLLKSGAEKLCFTFRLRPSFEITETLLPREHKEYKVICRLYSMSSGLPVGEGVGICSTMETKYRFRVGEVKTTGKPVPRDYWNMRESNPVKAQESIGGKGFTHSKINGVWEIVEKGERTEHDNPSDYYNTALKMAKKRAYVDAVITATAASDIFLQDLDDENFENVDKSTGVIKDESQKANRKSVSKKSKKDSAHIGTSLEEASNLLLSGAKWNSKVYSGNTVYLENTKFTFTDEELKQFQEKFNSLNTPISVNEDPAINDELQF